LPNNGLLDANVNTGKGPFQGGSESPSLNAWYEPWLDRNLLPDWLIRLVIRRLLAGRLRDEDLGDAERQRERLIRFIAEHRCLSGQHYQKTAEAWLRNTDARRPAILSLFEGTYGKEQALRWFVRWRVFFMACSELWGTRHGQEWIVSHYLMEKR
jgi:hypothetical protein